MTPFILKCRTKLPSEAKPSNDCEYDQDKQLWVEKNTGIPTVMRSGGCVKPSQFGETSITESHEGADQPDMATLRASQFGETTVTSTPEGTDQPHMVTLRASKFGETAVTRGPEGVDQPLAATLQASRFGETTITKAPEGADQADVIAEQVVARASYSHF